MSVSFYSILWYFLLYSVLGWCIEVGFNSIRTGKFVNRGFLNGPLCPIYGFGGVAVIVYLQPLNDAPLLLYVASVLLTSALELVGGYLLKTLFHTRWWDYTDQRFNVGGYICLKFSLAWGVACLFLIYVLHPPLAQLVELIPHVIGIILLIILYLPLISDLAVTVASIAKLNRDLGELSRVALKLREGSDALAESLGNGAISAAEKVKALDLPGKKEELTEKFEQGRQQLTASIDSARAEFSEELKEQGQQISNALSPASLKEHYQQMLASASERYARFLKAFPNMKNMNYPEILDELLRSKRKDDEDSENSE